MRSRAKSGDVVERIEPDRDSTEGQGGWRDIALSALHGTACHSDGQLHRLTLPSGTFGTRFYCVSC